jgi:uncharacterized membrane protein (UPF0127 family)
MHLMLLAAALLQEGEVSIGDDRLPVRIRARNGERGPAAMDFGAVKRGEGILVAFARDRHAHFYYSVRAGGGKRMYDAAFLRADGEVVEVTPLLAEELSHPEPPRGISAVRGITSSAEIRYALFLAPNSAGRLGVRKGAKAGIDLKGAEPEELPALELGEKRIRVEIVAAEPDRSRGLTYRPALSKGEGMIFAYPDAKRRPFWMYRTMISIDVSYVAVDGTLLEINPMKRLANPEDERAARGSMVPTKVEAPYVLETPIGWLQEAGFKVGDKLALPKELTSITPEKSPFE